MCELLGVSSSGYYAWIKRRRSQRAEIDAMLIAEIRVAHEASRGTYGTPRIHAELAAKGIRVGRKRVARLMLQAGLAGVCRRKFVTTTVKDGGRQAPDLVERNFTAAAPDRLWVADITYIPTWAGFLYLAVVLDAYSRRIVGWSMATTLAKQLVLDALNMALATRRPRDVIHHSDQGSQYTSIEFGRRCRDAGVRPSMGSVGDAYDNAMCESFFATLECELLERHRFKTQARREVRSSNSSKASIICAAVTPRSDISRRSTTSAGIVPTHTSLPSCSRPSRTSPPGGPKKGPSLTAAVRDGRTIVRAGTEEWLRRGPNQRMSRNRRIR
jgi:putative transposase